MADGNRFKDGIPVESGVPRKVKVYVPPTTGSYFGGRIYHIVIGS